MVSQETINKWQLSSIEHSQSIMKALKALKEKAGYSELIEQIYDDVQSLNCTLSFVLLYMVKNREQFKDV